MAVGQFAKKRICAKLVRELCVEDCLLCHSSHRWRSLILLKAARRIRDGGKPAATKLQQTPSSFTIVAINDSQC